MIQPVNASGLGTWLESIKLDTFSEKIKTVANDKVVSKHVETDEGDYCDKQYKFYLQKDLEALDQSIYAYAQTALDYAFWPVKILGEVIYAGYDLGKGGFQLVSELTTPRGSMGKIMSTAGYFLGFYISLQSSDLVCGWLISKTIERACIYKGAGYFSTQFVLAGAPLLLSVPLQVIFVSAGATAGKHLFVICKNCVWKLSSDIPEEKKLIEEWRKAGEKVKGSRLEPLDQSKCDLDEDLWDFEIVSSENDVKL